MFLYLGEGKYKRLSSLIGIFDMDSATVCVATRRFLSHYEKEGGVESDGELPKSFILCVEEEKEDKVSRKNKKSARNRKKRETVVLSKLASGVLLSRTARVRDDIGEEEN